MKQKMISLVVMLSCGVVWAQNTSREPLQGGATNPVTQHEADQSGEQKPLSDLVRKKKRKPKTTIKAEPAQPNTNTKNPTPISPTTPNDAKATAPATK